MPLVAHDNSWAICMPKKTGSQSLVEMLCAIADVGRLQGDWHGAAWNGTGRRMMIVRNPYERLASMHTFSMATNCHLFRGCDTPEMWLRRFFKLRAEGGEQQHEWTVTQSELAAEFKPEKVFRFEDGLEPVVAAVWTTIPVVHLNASDTDRGVKSFDVDGELADMLNEWCKPDMEAWY